MQDYYVDPEKLEYRPWLERVQPFTYNPTVPFFNILVPTADTTRYEFLLEALMGGNFNVMIGGETGTLWLGIRRLCNSKS